MTTHSPIGASSASRWFACPGSVHLSKDMPNESSPYALEGTAAHLLAERCLQEDRQAADSIGEVITVENSDFAVDIDMADAVQVYLDAIAKDRKEGDEIAVEQSFDLSSFFPGLYGTNDFVLYRAETGELFVYDLKFGAGVPVEVIWNLQLLYYALGAATAKRDRRLTSVTLVIVQPRCAHPDGPVRRWEISPLDLLDWSADLVDAAKATEQPDAPLKAGSHCKFCLAAAKCTALRDQVMSIAKADFTDGNLTLAEPKDFSEVDLAAVLKEADLIDDWIRRVREYAHHEADAGRMLPGFKLVAKRAIRAWRDKNKTLVSLLDFGLDQSAIYQDPKLKSPAQIEKTVGKKQMKQFSDLVVKNSSGAVLVEESDPREAVKSSAIEDFAK